MRSLAEVKTLKHAGIAAVLSALACLPRLQLWQQRPGNLWLLAAIVFLAAFLLWSFVFAWHARGSGRDPFVLDTRLKSWILATLAGSGAALFYSLLVDPITAKLHLEQFPKSFEAWGAFVLFAMAFEQLFLSFAPFAFFIRLSRRIDFSAALTVLFGVLILYLKLLDATAPVAFPEFAALLFTRILGNSLSIYFYVRGGVWLAWWWTLLLHARHLFGGGIWQ